MFDHTCAYKLIVDASRSIFEIKTAWVKFTKKYLDDSQLLKKK